MFTFIHLADLHFGKRLHSIELVDEEQPKWVDMFLEEMDAINPDAVVIAGDVYDTSIPGTREIALFDRFLTELSKRGKYVFIIPGNHDNHIRLSMGAKLYEDKKIYIARNVEKEIRHITVSETAGGKPITFWLLPYVFRKRVATLFEDANVDSFDAAFQTLLGSQTPNPDHVNILVAHQNVIGSAEDKPEASGSESVNIGGVGEVLAGRFADFDYVALGHIHRAQRVGRETIRYAGCPLYYDFSEVNRNKPLTIVKIGDDGSVTHEYRNVDEKLPYFLYQDQGTYDELKEKGKEWCANIEGENAARLAQGRNPRKYFVKLVVEGDIPSGGQDVLRKAYGHEVLYIISKRSDNAADLNSLYSTVTEGLTITEQFEQLYTKVNLSGKGLDNVQRKILNKVLEFQVNEGEHYVVDKTGVSVEDSDELIRAIEQYIAEEGNV